MARIQRHHISYDPEWLVEINMLMHRAISRVQATRATPQQYADLTNFLHAVAAEWNRMRLEMDTGVDGRVMSGGAGKLVRELRSENRVLKKKMTELHKQLRMLKKKGGGRDGKG